MAYMDEMALEREKSKQAMIAGKTPMFGADTTAAMHQLGISLGVIPPGTPPSQTTQVLEGLLRGGPGKVKVDEATPLKVQPLVGQLHASLQPQHTGGDEYGNILGGVGAATTNALQRLQQQRQQGPVGPASSSAAEPPGTNRARLSGRAPRAPEGPTYQADLAYLQARGGHHSVLQDGKIVNVPLTQAGSYKALDPELAARLRAAGETYEKENPGKQAKFGEFSRGNDVQKIYYDKVQATGQGKAAPPGASGHQIGMSGDLPPGEFRDWMYKGGQDRHGLHFPVKGDAPHVEVNPANKQSYSNPAAATPGAAPTAAPAADAQPRQGGSAVLAEQRKPVAQYLDSNPSAKEQMAAAAYTEDNNSREGRIAVHEAAANRIVANGRPVSDVIDPKYYQAMNDPAQRTKYDAALQKVKTDPEFRKQLFGEIDQAHKRGTNYAKLATDFASGTSADKSRTNSTSVGKVGGNEFFIKDQHPEVHGAGTVTNNKKWQADTQAALANAKPAAAPTATAQASPAPAAETPKPAEPTAPQASPQLGPSGEEPLQPEPTPAQNTPPSAPPAPVAVPSTPAPAAAAPVPPPVAAPPVTEAAKPAPPAPPPKPAAPPVNPAHAILDTKIGDLVKRGGTPAQAAQVPGWIANKTLREGMNMPVVGGQIAAGVEPYFGKMGITKQQFDQAVKEGPPKAATLGKRSDLGTSDATDFSSRGRTPAPAAAPEAAPAQSSAPAPGEQVPLPQPDPRTEQQPQITPGIAKALENVFKAEEQAPAAPPSAGAMPVLPGQPVAPTPGQGNGGLSLAPAGLSSIPTGALPTGAPGSQGGGIAMAGMLPPIQNSTYSTPLLDQTAATAGSGMGLSPIPLQTLGSWGWGGGSIGAGLDWGGGAPEVPIGVVGGFD